MSFTSDNWVTKLERETQGREGKKEIPEIEYYKTKGKFYKQLSKTRQRVFKEPRKIPFLKKVAVHVYSLE